MTDFEVFDETMTLEQYTESIIEYLMQCSWHYSRESACELAEHDKEYIAKCYAEKQSVSYCALDIGYCCG